MNGQRVRVAAVNDYELVVVGLAALIDRFPDRLVCVEAVTIGHPVRHAVDVALFDTYGRIGVGADALRLLAGDPKIKRVAVFTLQVTDELVGQAFAAGASGVISKAAPGDAIADAVVAVANDEQVVVHAPASHPSTKRWPGRARVMVSPCARARCSRSRPRGSPIVRSPTRCSSASTP